MLLLNCAKKVLGYASNPFCVSKIAPLYHFFLTWQHPVYGSLPLLLYIIRLWSCWLEIIIVETWMVSEDLQSEPWFPYLILWTHNTFSWCPIAQQFKTNRSFRVILLGIMGASTVLFSSLFFFFFWKSGHKIPLPGLQKSLLVAGRLIPRMSWTGRFGIVTGLDGQFWNPGWDPDMYQGVCSVGNALCTWKSNNTQPFPISAFSIVTRVNVSTKNDPCLNALLMQN